MAEVTEHLRDKIAEVRFARFISEVVWALGAIISIAGLYLKTLMLVIAGFPLLFLGLYLSVHYELQRLDYINALENLAHQGK